MTCVTTFLTAIANTITPPPTAGDLADLQFNMNNLTNAYEANRSDFDISGQLEKELEGLLEDELDRKFAESFYMRAASIFLMTLIYCVVITIAISQKDILVVFVVSIVVTMIFFVLVLALLYREREPFNIDDKKIEKELSIYESLKQNQLTYGVCAY